jgi:hypothetical protein
MFTKLSSIRGSLIGQMTIDELFYFIKNNPNKNKILKLRNINKELNRKEYDSLKLSLNAVIPSGFFRDKTNDSLIKLSGYLFFDIDNIDTINELNDTIKVINDTINVSMICKSPGGKGIHFLVRIDNIEKYNYNELYEYIFNEIKEMGFNLDGSAKGLSRKMCISYDENIIFNKDNFFELNEAKMFEWLRNNYGFKSLSKLNGKVKQNRERKENNDIELNDTFEIIDIDVLKNEIKFESKYTKDIDGLYKIENMEYYNIAFKKIIKDGDKHKTFTRIINALYFINGSNINRVQIYSYLHYVNTNFTTKAMKEENLLRLVDYICNSIEETGDIRIKPRIKKIHFNQEENLNKKQKQSMAAKINGKLRTNKTIDLITEAKEYFMSKNIHFTQKMVCEYTGLSIATIKRNWTKEITNEEDIRVEVPIYDTNIINSEITEDEFFNNNILTNKKIKIKYKGFLEVEIDEITNEDKKLFIDKIKALRQINLEPSEAILLELNLFDKYKTCFMYEKYTKIFGYAIQN